MILRAPTTTSPKDAPVSAATKKIGGKMEANPKTEENATIQKPVNTKTVAIVPQKNSF